MFELQERKSHIFSPMLYCESTTHNQLHITYLLTEWESRQDNIWLEVMTYEPRSLTSDDFFVAGGL